MDQKASFSGTWQVASWHSFSYRAVSSFRDAASQSDAAHGSALFARMTNWS
ncbi:MAG: hypothetical protein MUF57_09230 [Gammaproteobacteria bacterium]|jgi:hypothetical protein|nr:hypothetical protein [Gammaproteobacteria bacterium]